MLIAEYSTESPLLQAPLERVPGMVIRDEEEYVHDGAMRFIFWAEGGDFETFEAALEEESCTVDYRRLAETRNRQLYRVTVPKREAHESTTLLAWSDLDVVLQCLEGTHDRWDVRVRAPDRETVAQLRALYEAAGLPFEMRAIYCPVDDDAETPSLLTEPQYEALVSAYENGYFEVPRGATQADVAAELGISSQAFSERIRRGTGTLVDTVLCR